MSVGGSGFTQTIQNGGGMLYRALSSQASRSNKPVSVSLGPLAPMILAGSALLYQQGQDALNPNGQRGDSTWNILLESTLAYLTLQYTAGLYTLYGIGLAAYRAGQKPNAQEQIKSVINTAVTMFMGYMGVVLLGGMSKTADQMDDHAIYRLLRDPKMMMEGSQDHRWLDHLKDRAQHFEFTEAELEARGIALDKKPALDAKVKGLFRGVYDHLTQLRDTFGQMYPEWGDRPANKPPTEARFKQLSEQAMKLKGQAIEKLNILGQDAYAGIPEPDARVCKKAAKNLMGSIRNSQSAWSRIVRGLNPICGYMIVGLMLGTPIAQWIGSWFGKKRPDLQQRSFQQPLISPESRVMAPAANFYGGGQQQSGANQFAPGQPYMVWNGYNNNQPFRS